MRMHDAAAAAAAAAGVPISKEPQERTQVVAMGGTDGDCQQRAKTLWAMGSGIGQFLGRQVVVMVAVIVELPKPMPSVLRVIPACLSPLRPFPFPFVSSHMIRTRIYVRIRHKKQL